MRLIKSEDDLIKISKIQQLLKSKIPNPGERVNLLTFEVTDLIDEEAKVLNIENLFNQIARFTSLKTLNISISKCHFVLAKEASITFPQLSSFEFSGTLAVPEYTFQYFFAITKKAPSSMPHTNDIDFSFRIFTFGKVLMEQLEVLTKTPKDSRVKIFLLVHAVLAFPDELEIEFFVENQENSPVKNVALSFGIQYRHSEYKRLLVSLSQVFGEVSFKTYHRKDFDDEDFRDNEDERPDSDDEVHERNDEIQN